MTYVDRGEKPSTLTEVEMEFDRVDPCGPCSQHQRGVRWDVEIAGVMVHECDRVPPSWIGHECPCGCDLVRELRDSLK